MTYLNFLLIFLVIPLGGLAWLWLQGAGPSWAEDRRPAWLAMAATALVALLYTTPWDNYLVASRVWWYDPQLVTGLVLGWVPLEEYIFFVLQPFLTGLWLLYLARRLPPAPAGEPAMRRLAVAGVGLAWLGAMAGLASGWPPGTYLGLELAWALPPLMLQLAYGADILWRYRRLVLLTIGSSTLYLAGADALAISAGTWTINPALSLGIYLGGVLPLEELVFFLLTNTLITGSVVLLLAPQSRARFRLLPGLRPLAGGEQSR